MTFDKWSQWTPKHKELIMSKKELSWNRSSWLNRAQLPWWTAHAIPWLWNGLRLPWLGSDPRIGRYRWQNVIYNLDLAIFQHHFQYLVRKRVFCKLSSHRFDRDVFTRFNSSHRWIFILPAIWVNVNDQAWSKNGNLGCWWHFELKIAITILHREFVGYFIKTFMKQVQRERPNDSDKVHARRGGKLADFAQWVRREILFVSFFYPNITLFVSSIFATYCTID